jgi:Tol biopolymer transport system component
MRWVWAPISLIVFAACSREKEEFGPGGRCTADDQCAPCLECHNGSCEMCPDAGFPDAEVSFPDADPPDIGCVPSIVRVSVGPGGIEVGAGTLASLDISGDGRFISFTSSAAELIPDDNNQTFDVFVHDTVTGTTSRVSVAVDDSELNNKSGWVDEEDHKHDLVPMSADGRFVLFATRATNHGYPPDRGHLLVRDREMGTTQLVTVTSDEVPANSGSPRGVISGDGRWVAFHSVATNLAPGDTMTTDIFLRDLVNGETKRITDNSAGPRVIEAINYDGSLVLSTLGVDNLPVPIMHVVSPRAEIPFPPNVPNPDIHDLEMSDDGNIIAFWTQTPLKSPPDTGRIENNYVYVRTSSEAIPLELKPNGVLDAIMNHDRLEVSSDGARIVFSSYVDVDPRDQNESKDIYVFEMATRTAHIVSVGLDGLPAGGSASPAISADGRWIAFWSEASNLIAEDSNNAGDIFLARLCPR